MQPSCGSPRGFLAPLRNRIFHPLPSSSGSCSMGEVLSVNGKFHPFLLFCTSFMLNEVHP